MTMIKFNLNNTYSIVPEGKQELTIKKAEAKPSGKPSAIHITWTDNNGAFINDRYDLSRDVAVTKLGILIKTALELPNMSEFDTKDLNKLEGKKLLCEVVHTEGNLPREDGSYPKFANVRKILSLVESGEPKATGSVRDAILNNTDDDLD